MAALSLEWMSWFYFPWRKKKIKQINIICGEMCQRISEMWIHTCLQWHLSILKEMAFFPQLTNPRNWCCKKELTPDLSSHIFPSSNCWYPKIIKPLTDKLVEIANSFPEGIISKSAFADFFQKNGISKRGKVLIYHLNPPMHCGSQSTGLSYQMWSVHCQGGAFPDLHLQNQLQVREGWAEFTCQEKVPDIQTKTTG